MGTESRGEGPCFSPLELHAGCQSPWLWADSGDGQEQAGAEGNLGQPGCEGPMAFWARVSDQTLKALHCPAQRLGVSLWMQER